MYFQRRGKRLALMLICKQRFCTKKDVVKRLEDIPTGGFYLPVVGTLFSMISAGGPANLHNYVDQKHKQLGDIFKEKFGPLDIIFLSDASAIKAVFVNEGPYPRHVLPESWLLYNKLYNAQRGIYFMDGVEWFEYRQILTNLMLKPEFVSKASYLCEDILGEIFTDWINESSDAEVLLLENKLYNLSIMFIVAYLLGSPFKNNAALFSDNITKMSTIVQGIFKCSVPLSVIPPELAARFRMPIWKKFVQSIDLSINTAKLLLQDIISLKGDGIANDLLNLNIPMEMIRRLVVDFIIAAGDTTANTMQWTLYLLGKNTDIQNELFDELNKCENLSDSSLLKNVLKESMRLYPVAPFIGRYLAQEAEICGYLIPPQQLISLSMYTTSRSELYFPQSQLFIPNRWNRSGEDYRYEGVTSAQASLPFSMGKRSCLGSKLAHAQLSVSIAKIIKMYRIETLEDVDVKLDLIVVPSKPVRLRFHKRY